MNENKDNKKPTQANYTEVAGPLLFMVIVLILMICLSKFIG